MLLHYTAEIILHYPVQTQMGLRELMCYKY